MTLVTMRAQLIPHPVRLLTLKAMLSALSPLMRGEGGAFLHVRLWRMVRSALGGEDRMRGTSNISSSCCTSNAGMGRSAENPPQ